MQPPEPGRGPESVMPALSPYSHGADAVQSRSAGLVQPEWGMLGSELEQVKASGINGAAVRPLGGDGLAFDNSPWGAHGPDQPALATDLLSRQPQEAGGAWDSGLWGGGRNIWSTGPAQDAARARRSIDVPFRSEEGVFSRAPGPSDCRRSLDSLKGLQMIWQAQQQSATQQLQQQQAQSFSQQPFAQLQREQLLAQQINGLNLQDASVPFLQQQLAPGLGSVNGGYHANGGGLVAPGNGLPPARPAPYLPHSLQSSQALGLGLSPAQLQAALQDPAAAKLLRRRLEAAAILNPQLHQPQVLDESLLLARQNGGVHALLSNGIRQPPPPPPRASRIQLPPPLQKVVPAPPPPRAQGATNGVKKSTAPSQRTPARDRAALLGSKPKANMETLDKALHDLVESLHPSPEELQKQQAAFQKVSKLLTARWPHATVHQFGSTANSLSICNNNDIDVCLEIMEPEGEPHFKSQLIEEMGDLLTDAGMANVLPLPKARVPVVKFAVPETGTKVDVSVNNSLALINTKLLLDYSAINSRLLQLAFIVKHWAKRRQVNDSYRGTLSSYCYVLMCIHHLQTREPPVLPCLQAIQPPTHIRTIGRWNCDYYDKPMPDFGKDNKESLADLVWSFFENWAWRHDYNNAVVSVRTGSLLTKAQKDWTRRIGNERHLICIEDPFETSHDLGRTVDRQTSGVLHKEFERAACVLRDQEEPLAQLFEPYRAGKAP